MATKVASWLVLTMASFLILVGCSSKSSLARQSSPASQSNSTSGVEPSSKASSSIPKPGTPEWMVGTWKCDHPSYGNMKFNSDGSAANSDDAARYTWRLSGNVLSMTVDRVDLPDGILSDIEQNSFTGDRPKGNKFFGPQPKAQFTRILNTGNVDPVSAVQIIARMAQTYAQCKSYVDTGTDTRVMKSKSGGETTEVRQFSTAVVRPNQFRFEYSKKGKIASGCVVWKSGQDIRSWWGDAQKFVEKRSPERNKSLGFALALASIVSDGAAQTIPALLMPSEVMGTKLTDIEKPVRGEDKSIDGRNCFSIQGSFPYPLPICRCTIWIDQESFLVRRIEQSYQLGDGVTVIDQRTVYQPVINQDVAAKLLEYNPPK